MCRLMSHHDVQTVTSDQGEYGLLTRGPGGKPMLARKRTRWATNSPQMIDRLSRRCSGQHAHQPLEGGRTKDAA